MTDKMTEYNTNTMVFLFCIAFGIRTELQDRGYQTPTHIQFCCSLHIFSFISLFIHERLYIFKNNVIVLHKLMGNTEDDNQKASN